MKVGANDLRIGNYIESECLDIPREGIHQKRISGKCFTAITGYGIYLVEQENTIFKPIKLTEEWCESFGFERKPNYRQGLWKEWGCLSIRFNKSKMELWSYTSVLIGISDPFVHQLQNLWFSLTNEELKLTNNDLHSH